HARPCSPSRPGDDRGGNARDAGPMDLGAALRSRGLPRPCGRLGVAVAVMANVAAGRVSNPGPIGVLVRTAGKTAVLAGFAVLGWTVDRHALWGAVGVALAGASLILCGAALLRRALRAAALRARLHGVSLADLDGLPGAG